MFLFMGVVFIISCNSSTSDQEKAPNEVRLYKGMFSYVAASKEVYFTECGQESTVSMKVLKEYDFASLFTAYQKVQTDNEVDFVYVEFEGYQPDHEKETEDERIEIAISTFKKLKKKRKCN